MKNKTTHHFYFNLLSLLLPIFIFSFFLSSANADSFNNGGLTDTESLYIKQRQLLYYRDEFGDRGENVTIDSSLVFENPRLRNAYIALQAWKEAILSDPQNLTGNWVGSDVCHYTGVYCAQALDNHSIKTVAGIDLNHGDIAGYLPEELGLLTDLALFHINSNRFCGTVPHKFKNLKLLYELDLSNNRFAGKFPLVVLKLPVLKFLDLRFNEFEGNVPNKLFDKDLDAIFINHNRFQFELPDNFGNSPVSVIVVANNKFRGCVPASLGNMSRTLNEIILMENGLRSCLPPEIGLLKELTVFDVSFNELMGSLPETIAGMVKVEQLNVAHRHLKVEQLNGLFVGLSWRHKNDSSCSFYTSDSRTVITEIIKSKVKVNEGDSTQSGINPVAESTTGTIVFVPLAQALEQSLDVGSSSTKKQRKKAKKKSRDDAKNCRNYRFCASSSSPRTTPGCWFKFYQKTTFQVAVQCCFE